MVQLEEIAAVLKQQDNWLILGHVDPDGDCLGSLFALKWILDYLDKNSLVLLKERPEGEYGHLEVEDGDYCLFQQFNLQELEWESFHLAALDAGDRDRLDDNNLFSGQNVLLNIDHHPGNPAYGEYNYIAPDKAAVGVIIYELVQLLGIPLGRRISTALATAILADTGGLRYQNTTADLYRIMADLVENGADNYNINKTIFGNYSYSSIKLTGLVLATLKLSEDGKIAWIRVEQSLLVEAGVRLDETSGLVNYPRDIQGVEVGLAFYEQYDGSTRVSLRSNHYCPVDEIAASFGGGGHQRAAGCKLDKPLDKAVELVMNKVKAYV